MCISTPALCMYIRLRVLPRNGLKKVEAKGMFIEAKVVRGRNWKWKDQDGEHLCVDLYIGPTTLH